MLRFSKAETKVIAEGLPAPIRTPVGIRRPAAIDTEAGDLVAVLVGRVETLRGRIEGEEPRPRPAGRKRGDVSQMPGVRR